MSKKNKFAIIGVAGFVAKKHIAVLKKLKCELVMAMDLHDNVGFLDNSFPKCIFYKNEKKFFSNLKIHKITHVIICTPNYLHFRHIEKTLKNQCHAICEKPTVINFTQLLKVTKLEKKFNKKCFPIFQLRQNQNLINLKKEISHKLFKNFKKLSITIKYITVRGNWYLSSWKGDQKKSGGLILNIGIHFVDILSWFFGKCTKVLIKQNTKKILKGNIQFKNSNIEILLSTDRKFIKNHKTNSLRVMKIENKEVDFTDNFNNLHLNCYKQILKNKSISAHDLHDTFYNLKIIQNEI